MAPCPSVTPTAPTKVDQCGIDNDKYTIPATTGVEYLVDGKVKAPGTYSSGGATSLTVTSKALSDYTLAGTSSWTLTWDTTPCPIKVTPIPPNKVNLCGNADDSYAIPQAEGVEYLIDGKVKPSGSYSASEFSGQGLEPIPLHITAQAKAGYETTGTNAWVLTWPYEACASPTVVPSPSSTVSSSAVPSPSIPASPPPTITASQSPTPPKPTVIPTPAPTPTKTPVLPVKLTPERIAGASAIDTNLRTVDKGFAKAKVVYVANDAAFADALSAGPAAAKEGGALLLVHPTEVPAATMAKLKALAPKKVVLQGGRFALSPEVEAEIKKELPKAKVIRNAGKTAQLTAVETAKRAFDKANTVYLANDESFADALAAGPVAGQKQAPILLVSPNNVSMDVLAEVQRINPKQVVIVGGRFAVSPAIMAAIKLAYGIDVIRVSGDTEIDTALAIAETAPVKRQIFLTNNVAFPDAPGAGPVAAKGNGVVLSTNGRCLTPAVSDRIDKLSGEVQRLYIVGGKRAMSEGLMKLKRCI